MTLHTILLRRALCWMLRAFPIIIIVTALLPRVGKRCVIVRFQCGPGSPRIVPTPVEILFNQMKQKLTQLSEERGRPKNLTVLKLQVAEIYNCILQQYIDRLYAGMPAR